MWWIYYDRKSTLKKKLILLSPYQRIAKQFLFYNVWAQSAGAVEYTTAFLQRLRFPHQWVS